MLCFGKLLVAKSLRITWEKYQNFKPKVFRLTVPKSLVSESYSVLLFSDNENFFSQRVMLLVFLEPSCLAVPKNFVRESFVLCFRKFAVPKILWVSRWSITICR